MKSLVLLSFSLTFLTQAFADDSFAAEPSEPVSAEESGGNQVIPNDSFAADPVKNPEPKSYLTDDEQSPVPMESENSSQGEWCLSPYHEMHASIRHNEARGIGYKDGYTTLEAFGIYDGIGSGFMPFVDLRGHIFNNGYLAGNVGIGERTLFTSINHTLGSYLYYDVRRVGHGLTVNQLSPGIELVGERMEYRINGYFPLGKQKGHQYGFDFAKFKGNNILLKSKEQQAMRGFDAEVGAHIPQNTTYDIYAAAGPYYFKSTNASSWGGRARVLGRYKEYVTLEVAYSYDNLFRSVVQGSVAFTLPFGRKLQRCGRCCPQTDNLLLSRAAFAPSRFEIPVVKKIHKHNKAINPATGKPWVVWFVNNTSHSAGTFESPFPTLLQAQNASSPNDMIYVFPGDGTTNGMNAGITLQNGQNFFGSGIKQQFATTKSTMTIPAMSSNNPSITTTTIGGGAVMLGNGNVVSGFNILNSVMGALGIATSPIGVNGATIKNNVITFTIPDPAIIGIGVAGFGNWNISNNQIIGNNIGDGYGMIVESVGGTMNGVISNNSISVTAVGIEFTYKSGSGNFTIIGNTITNYGQVGMVGFLGGEAILTMTGNSLNGNVGINSILIEDTMVPINLTYAKLLIDSNSIVSTSPSASRGIFVDIFNAAASSSNVSITNNSLQATKSTFSGIDIMTGNSNTICLDLDMNTVITVPGATGYVFTATAGTINIESIQGNVGGSVSATGNVNFVAPGSCGN